MGQLPKPRGGQSAGPGRCLRPRGGEGQARPFLCLAPRRLGSDGLGDPTGLAASRHSQFCGSPMPSPAICTLSQSFAVNGHLGQSPGQVPCLSSGQPLGVWVGVALPWPLVADMARAWMCCLLCTPHLLSSTRPSPGAEACGALGGSGGGPAVGTAAPNPGPLGALGRLDRREPEPVRMDRASPCPWGPWPASGSSQREAWLVAEWTVARQPDRDRARRGHCTGSSAPCSHGGTPG